MYMGLFASQSTEIFLSLTSEKGNSSSKKLQLKTSCTFLYTVAALYFGGLRHNKFSID
jgi:hypothetical protein